MSEDNSSVPASEERRFDDDGQAISAVVGDGVNPEDLGPAAASEDAPALTIPEPPSAPDIPAPPGPDPAPEVPDLPEIPDAPAAPEVPEVPEIANAAEAARVVEVAPAEPEAAQVGEVAEDPAVPEIPDAAEAPEVAETPEAAETPEVAEAPEVAKAPEVPEAAAAVEPAVTPASVDTPGAPTTPGDSDNLGEMPQVEPAHPVAPMPTVTPERHPAPMPTVTPAGPRPAGQRSKGGRPGGPGARPGGPGGRPGGRPSPVPSAPLPVGVVEPIVESVDPHLWGRIDEDGVVYVTTSAGERAIGNWQAGDTEAGLQHFGRRFDDFSTEIGLLEARLASGTGDPKATKTQAIALRETVETLPAIGDLDSAAIRLEIVIGAADAAIAGASHARTAARAAAIKAKEALCVEAEELAESTQWKTTGDRLKAIVEEWRTIRGIDRKTDDALWKRFAKARDTFTRHRGSHFAELDKQRGAAKDAKEELIKKAEALSDATDWGETAGAYRALMEEWKAAGRAPRDVEDALWARFRAAQEKFFSRRNKTFSDRDAEFEANAAIKEKLLEEAEKLDPAAGLDAAKAKMRSIQERWEAAGKVPRERIREFDQRLHAVEEKLKSAEDRHWRRTDPETTARVEQFRARVDTYRAQAAKARAAGDERKAKEADKQAAQWEEWLKTAQGAVDG